MTFWDMMYSKDLLSKPAPIGITVAGLMQIAKVHRKNKKRRWTNGGRKRK